MTDTPVTKLDSVDAAECLAWLRERYDNCIRLAAQKAGDETAILLILRRES
jgi:hypothetical protein